MQPKMLMMTTTEMNHRHHRYHCCLCEKILDVDLSASFSSCLSWTACSACTGDVWHQAALAIVGPLLSRNIPASDPSETCAELLSSPSCMSRWYHHAWLSKSHAAILRIGPSRQVIRLFACSSHHLRHHACCRCWHLCSSHRHQPRATRSATASALPLPLLPQTDSHAALELHHQRHRDPRHRCLMTSASTQPCGVAVPSPSPAAGWPPALRHAVARLATLSPHSPVSMGSRISWAG
mmetsp:Transcript_7544/g.20414  ORF Transcript_7544/g.20414 Transcript_7544/m.20414 type:complete len:237 (+) Transcript_7544:989-1699(+)